MSSPDDARWHAVGQVRSPRGKDGALQYGVSVQRLAIDTNALYVSKAGVARYVRNLLAGLRRLPPGTLDLTELAWPVENFDYRQPMRAAKTFFREIIWSRLQAPRELVRRNIDLLHSPALPLVSPPATIRHVVTLHDLALLRHPERYRRWSRIMGPRHLNRLVRAQRLICVSRFTADEAMELLGLPAASLCVVHEGGDHLPPPVAPDFVVPGEFLLFVGSLEPGKNLELLRQAYAVARAAGKHLPPLLIVGARWPAVAREGAPPADWRYLGHLPDAVLAWLYRRAIALVFPSKYEGFGLPLVEAMQAGCPVICSRVASLPEIGGEAVRWCEATPAAYAEAMRELASDSAQRDAWIARGKLQAAPFTWERCARETAEIYRGL